VDCLSSHGDLGNYEFLRSKQRELPPEQLKPARLVTGKDLIAAGYRPGPMFGVVLGDIEDAQLEGRISTPDEALRMAKEKLSALTDVR
jgi:poly(A) polymerase